MNIFKYSIILFLFCVPNYINASIFCPENKVLNCTDELSNLDKTGRPILMGNSYGHQAKYVDNNQLNSCNAGFVYRTWYVDINQNDRLDQFELSCIQTLQFNYLPQTITINFPTNKIYDCKEKISLDKPTWVSGPCDVLGYSYTDEKFEISSDACYKILRKFKVVNWCNSIGGDHQTWMHTQVIKVIDNTKPSINNCLAQTVFGTDQDCKAEVILTTSAFDAITCSAQNLLWTAQIDLWGDGSIDLTYGFNLTGEFKLNPTKNNEEISIKLPNRIGIGKHKIHWNVRDECGNAISCHSDFEVKDLKKPTPYLHLFLTASFDAQSMPLMLPARIFNVNSEDNCSPKNKLTYAFSNDPKDSIKIIDCNNFGFQFFTIYVFDEYGNIDFAEVFMIVFDNGTCSGSFSFPGKIARSNGSAIENSMLFMENGQESFATMSAIEGEFLFEDIPLYDNFKVWAEVDESINGKVDIADFLMLQDYLLGKGSLKDFEWLAADVDLDGKVKISDLTTLRNFILKNEKSFQLGRKWKVVADPKEITKNNLESQNEKLSILNFDGNIDFSAVCLGDITEANTIEGEGRSLHFLDRKIENNTLKYKVTQDYKLKGLQLEIIIPEVFQYDLKSEFFKFQFDNSYFDEAKQTLRVMIANEFSINIGEVLFSLDFVPSAESRVMPSLSQKNNTFVDEKGQAHTIRERLISTNTSNLVISPNPLMGDQFFINQTDAIVNMIYTLEGRTINFMQVDGMISLLDNQLANGLYFVSLTTANGAVEVVKLFVIR